jgi:hypothetical protein
MPREPLSKKPQEKQAEPLKTPPPLHNPNRQSPYAPLSSLSGNLYWQLMPAVKLEKEFPGKRFPDTNTPFWTAKSSISLVCSIVASPKSSLFEDVILSKNDVSVEMAKLATSFGFSKTGKSMKDVTFSSTNKGVGDLKSQTFKIRLPSTAIWGSKLDLQSLTFERVTVSGNLSIQLKITVIPKQPPLSPVRIPSTKPVSKWQELVRDHGYFLAVVMMIGIILLMVLTYPARAATIIVPPGNLGPDGEIPEDKRMA